MCPIVPLTASRIYLISCAVKKPRLEETEMKEQSDKFAGALDRNTNALVSMLDYMKQRDRQMDERK